MPGVMEESTIQKTQMRRTSLDLPEAVVDLVEQIRKATGQTRASVIRNALVFFHFILSKIDEGYELQLKHTEKHETIIIPGQLVGSQGMGAKSTGGAAGEPRRKAASTKGRRSS